MKVDFIDNDHLIIYYITNSIVNNKEEMEIVFRFLDKQLKNKYDYEFHGYYNVIAYNQDNILILDCENIDDFGGKDFNITFYKKCILLYEFDDFDLIKGDKLFYNNKYYCELEQLPFIDCLFEYGKIVYGSEVEKIINRGILIKDKSFI